MGYIHTSLFTAKTNPRKNHLRAEKSRKQDRQELMSYMSYTCNPKLKIVCLTWGIQNTVKKIWLASSLSSGREMQWNNNSSRVETSSRRWMATVLHINCWKALHRDLTIKKHSEYRKCKGPCSQMAKDTGITVQSLISTSTDSFLWTQYPSLSNLP